MSFQQPPLPFETSAMRPSTCGNMPTTSTSATSGRSTSMVFGVQPTGNSPESATLRP